jgi:hypothetical protein
MNRRKHPELIFAMTRAIGTDSRSVISEVTSLLLDAQYQVASLQLQLRLEQTEEVLTRFEQSSQIAGAS